MFHVLTVQESLGNAKVSMRQQRQQCVYEGP